MNPNVVLFSVGLVSLDTAIAASITPSPTCWRRCAGASVFSWACTVGFAVAAVGAMTWWAAVSAAPSLLAALYNTRDAISERRRYLAEKAAHERAVDEVVRAIKSLPSRGSA